MTLRKLYPSFRLDLHKTLYLHCLVALVTWVAACQTWASLLLHWANKARWWVVVNSCRNLTPHQQTWHRWKTHYLSTWTSLSNSRITEWIPAVSINSNRSSNRPAALWDSSFHNIFSSNSKTSCNRVCWTVSQCFFICHAKSLLNTVCRHLTVNQLTFVI